MPRVLQLRRGPSSEIAQTTGADGEVFVDETKDTLVVMDGVTQGGQPLQKELVSGQTIKTVDGQSLLGSGNISTQPQLKTVNGESLVGTGDINTEPQLKTVNGESLVGTGDIQIQAGAAGNLTFPLYSAGPNDNRYSDQSYTVSGPTAGTSINLPVIEVGQVCEVYFDYSGAFGDDVWKIQLPSIPGTDLTSFYNNMLVMAPYITETEYYGNPNTLVAVWSIISQYIVINEGPADAIYLEDIGFDFNVRIKRVPNLTIPGFGTIAFFKFEPIPASVGGGVSLHNYVKVISTFPTTTIPSIAPFGWNN